VKKSLGNQSKSIEPRRDPVQARSRARFERILDASSSLILEKGSDAVTMNDIASSARISIASLYQYFPDKVSIIAALANRFNQMGQACVHNAFVKVVQPGDLVHALCEMVDGYYEFFCEVPAAYSIWQATQSNKRLQEIDAEDMACHAEVISKAFRRADLEMSEDESLRLGAIYTHIVASCVRLAASIDSKEEGSSVIGICKEVVITPSVQRALAKKEPYYGI
jgi:AcrR family transcriptional regulator